MSERRRILLFSIGAMVAVSLSASALTMYLLYDAAFERHRAGLREVVHNRAHIIESAVRSYSRLTPGGVPGGASAATLRQIADAQEHFEGFGETGEFTLARREGDSIVWLLSHRHSNVEKPDPTPFHSDVAEPMRRALEGISGSVIGPDYRGARVLAAYEPIPDLGWGVVAKIDIAEINRPFAIAGLFAGGVALVFVAIGVGFIFRVVSPLVQRLEDHTEELREARERLEARVAERTKQLSESNLSLREKIREHERAEAALSRMSKVFMDAVVPILIEDLSGRIIAVNTEAEKTYGWTREELLGLPMETIVPPELRAQQRALSERCRRGESVRDVEGVRQTKSGDPVPVLLTLSLLTDEDGKAVATATIAKDISELKYTEAKLREERDFAEGVIETARVIVLELDSDGRILRFNPYMAEVSGHRLEEVRGEDWITTLLPERGHEAMRELFAASLGGVRTGGTVSPIVTKDGAEREITWYGTRLEDDEGNAVGLLVVGHDITDQKRLARQLRAAASEAAMAEERERRKLAVDLHDGLAQLLTLASMKLGMLRSLGDAREIGERIREIEGLIGEAHERAGSLTFQLSPPILHDMGLGAASQWLADDLEQRYGLKVALEDGRQHDRIDEGVRIALFRSLRELLINVSKHAGTNRAQVRLHRDEQLTSITVEDDGTGFDPDVETSGFGLFSIRERMNHLGGTMQIESAPGDGTRVVLSVSTSAAESRESEGSV